ncbi:MAG: hypothetical protein A2086_13530 [Spirochaetes bacterium GWD1_27_9]|nr:MAG: hypothetical protein A2Z98_12845 [Spirochaetes bacterium GWB1_27_13]OHD23115.1 MAG: hypothetical protein A2Y34_17015 [Spirochaetes bacterium GWC1_27_15]OHD39927.1 MAG: hypothetical protein A2086_13530 [Spirochaetes bacterium GWD1_27_9]
MSNLNNACSIDNDILSNKKQLEIVFNNLYNWVESDKNWLNILPLVEKTNFYHPQFGRICYSLNLDKKFNADFHKELAVLTLKVESNKTISEKQICIGEYYKVKSDIKNFCEDIDLIEDKLQHALI